MLDLKAKLAAAGLVSAADVAAAERKDRHSTGPKGQDRKASPSRSGDTRGPREHGGDPQARGDNRSPRAHGGDPQARGGDPQARGGDPQTQGGNSQARGGDTQAHGGNHQARGDNRGPRGDNRGPNGPRGDNRGPNGPRGDNRGPNGPRGDNRGPRPAPASKPGLDVVALKRAGKGEAYDAIRRAVDRTRLDAVRAIPSEQAEAFHFTTATGQLSRLMLEPDVRTGLAEGTAAIIAFMSHHGLAHCVVPRPLAEAVAEVFPLWLRVLKDHPGAGQQEAPKPPPEPSVVAATPAPEPHTSDAAASEPRSASTPEPRTSEPAASEPPPSDTPEPETAEPG